MRYIVAIGGYEDEDQKAGFIKTPLVIDQKIVSLSAKDDPNFLFVPTASSDSRDYIKSIENIYGKELKCSFDTLLLHADDLNLEDIKRKIEWADIIYVGGGNTMMMLEKWKHFGVDLLLKDAYKQGKILCGVSAGSICWFDYGISDSLHFYDKSIKEYIKLKGLGMIPGLHCPHYKSKLWDKGYRTDGMKKILAASVLPGGSGDKCLAIPDGCAVIFENEQIVDSVASVDLADSVGELGEKPVYCYWDKGEWVEEGV